VLALVAGIVVAAGRSALMALLGSSPALALGRVTATPRAVALTAITAATDPKELAAAPAEPPVKGGDLKRWQDSLLTRRWTAPPACARLTSDLFCLGL
jgi:hypothetical protein